MSFISITTPNDGDSITAASVATPLNTITNAINGNLDNTNIKSGAAIDGSKIADNSIPYTKLINGAQGWTALANTPNTITSNSSVPNVYDVVFNSVDLTGTLSNGMKLQLTRTVAAPSQCTSLNGTNQYYSKSSPSAMTFTDDFVVSAWIKLSSYSATDISIVSRYNGTSGWDFQINTLGQINLIGFNGGTVNFSKVNSYASIPLNRWVHVSAQLDMSIFTATTTTSYVMIDGVDVPVSLNRAGTNPTALVQAGNLEIGSRNAGTQPFPGKIAQVAIYNAKVTQATILASKNQTLSGSETSLVSAYSFNNTINDLSSNANNLTAQNSAVATNADSPFGNSGVSTTLEYAEVLNVAYSTNTTVTVRVPAGCQLPTSGGISTVYYSTQSNPYGCPVFSNVLRNIILGSDFTTTSTSAAQINGLSASVYVPTGRQIKVTLFAYRTGSSAGVTPTIDIWLGTVGSGTRITSAYGINSSTLTAETTCSNVFTPSSSSITLNGAIYANGGAATVTFPSNPASGAASYLLVELV